jgi:hypothetical protein
MVLFDYDSPATSSQLHKFHWQRAHALAYSPRAAVKIQRRNYRKAAVRDFLWGGNNAWTKWLVAVWPPIWTGGSFGGSALKIYQFTPLRNIYC